MNVNRYKLRDETFRSNLQDCSSVKPSSVRKRASNGRPRTEFKKAGATGYKGKTFAKAKPDFKDGGGSFGRAKPGFKKKRSGFKKG